MFCCIRIGRMSISNLDNFKDNVRQFEPAELGLGGPGLDRSLATKAEKH